MIASVSITFLNLFVFVIDALILVRVLLSWVVPDLPAHRATALVYNLTEPVLAPIRRLLPKSWVVDLSPLVTFFALQLLLALLNRLTLGI